MPLAWELISLILIGSFTLASVAIYKSTCSKVVGEVEIEASAMLYCLPTLGAPVGM